MGIAEYGIQILRHHSWRGTCKKDITSATRQSRTAAFVVAVFLCHVVVLAGDETPQAAEYQVGTAVADITPELPFWLTGFAARTRPANKVSLPIHAKALAIVDSHGGRIVIVTADLLGVTREITNEVAARLAASKYGLHRNELCSTRRTRIPGRRYGRDCISHLSTRRGEPASRRYGRRLIDTFTNIAQQALANLSPADIEFGYAPEGTVQFATNRRIEHLARVHPNAHAPAPVDHSVPVWRFVSREGSSRVRAVLFGYACHNTVMTAEFNEVNGDYAGYAQQAIERTYPGSTALFLTLCAGDQRPNPRSTRELAEKHGETLARAVSSAVVRSVHGPVRTTYEEIRLPFQAHTREHYAAESTSADFFAARRGKAMLAAYDAGHPVVDTPYPVSAISFGTSVALVALGGEAVIDYDIRLKSEYKGVNLVVAAYSNDVMGYIPSLRVLREGGYEAGDAMMYYVQPGWFTDQVENLVIAAAHSCLRKVGVVP